MARSDMNDQMRNQHVLGTGTLPHVGRGRVIVLVYTRLNEFQYAQDFFANVGLEILKQWFTATDAGKVERHGWALSLHEET